MALRNWTVRQAVNDLERKWTVFGPKWTVFGRQNWTVFWTLLRGPVSKCKLHFIRSFSLNPWERPLFYFWTVHFDSFWTVHFHLFGPSTFHSTHDHDKKNLEDFCLQKIFLHLKWMVVKMIFKHPQSISHKQSLVDTRVTLNLSLSESDGFYGKISTHFQNGDLSESASESMSEVLSYSCPCPNPWKISCPNPSPCPPNSAQKGWKMKMIWLTKKKW